MMVLGQLIFVFTLLLLGSIVLSYVVFPFVLNLLSTVWEKYCYKIIRENIVKIMKKYYIKNYREDYKYLIDMMAFHIKNEDKYYLYQFFLKKEYLKYSKEILLYTIYRLTKDDLDKMLNEKDFKLHDVSYNLKIKNNRLIFFLINYFKLDIEFPYTVYAANVILIFEIINTIFFQTKLTTSEFWIFIDKKN